MYLPDAQITKDSTIDNSTNQIVKCFFSNNSNDSTTEPTQSTSHLVTQPVIQLKTQLKTQFQSFNSSSTQTYYSNEVESWSTSSLSSKWTSQRSNELRIKDSSLNNFKEASNDNQNDQLNESMKMLGLDKLKLDDKLVDKKDDVLDNDAKVLKSSNHHHYHHLNRSINEPVYSKVLSLISYLVLSIFTSLLCCWLKMDKFSNRMKRQINEAKVECVNIISI